MSHTLKLRVPDAAYLDLAAFAAAIDQTPTKTALQLFTHALANATKRGRLPPARIPAAPVEAPGPRPSHIPAPIPGQEIPTETWEAIVALHARYRRELERLKDGWWEDNSQCETLAALASWRHQLDTTPDPREELSYQHQLQAFARHLQTQPGSTSSQWQPAI
jgi:hypothetical protein